jgi:hypothetical protein
MVAFSILSFAEIIAKEKQSEIDTGYRRVRFYWQSALHTTCEEFL